MSTPPTDFDDASAQARDVHARDVIRFLRNGLPLALLVGLAAGAAAFLIDRSAAPIYRATAALLAAEPSGGFTDVEVVAPSRVEATVYRVALLEGPVLMDALERVNGETPSESELEAFSRRLDVDIDEGPTSSVVRISFEHPDPQYAAVTVNTIADSLIAWDRDRARQGAGRSIEAIERSIAALDERIRSGDDVVSDERATALLAMREQRVEELELARAGDTSAVAVGRLEPLRVAAPPERPVGPRIVFDTFVGALLGMILAYAFVFVRASLDRRVRDRDQLARLAAAPVLAEFPRRSRAARALADESAGFFHTNLLLATERRTPLVIGIASPLAIEEKDGVPVALAESFARGGSRTLLVDGDLRRPGTTEGLDVKTKQSAPFEVHLSNPQRRYAPATVAIGGKGTFDFVPSFTAPEHPVELLNRGLRERVAGWREDYDVVIIDASPVLPFADALAVGLHCDGMVLCVRHRDTSHDAVRESVELLRRSGVPVMGAVLTGAPARYRPHRPAPAVGARTRAAAGSDGYRTLPRTSERRPTGAADRR